MRKSALMKALLSLIVILLLVPYQPGYAKQASGIPLSVGVPPGFESLIKPVLQRFEEANPTVQVEVRLLDAVERRPGKTNEEIEKYYANWAHAAGIADVLMVANDLGPEATRAGFILDLKGLIRADASLNESDYQAQSWQAFQWDNGVWALPLAYDMVSFLYNSEVFKAAGMAPPSPAWTFDDLAAAARALAVRKDGKVEVPGLYVDNVFLPPLLMALTGQGFSDETAIPAVPTLATPKLDSLVQDWRKLEAEGVVTRTRPTSETVPLQVGISSMLRTELGSAARKLAGAVLPGGKVAVFASGFAVSGGTAYPDQAYGLAKFLSSDPGTVQATSVSFAAKTSLQTPDNGDNTGHVLSPDDRAFIAKAIENTIPASDLMFGEYLVAAITAGAGVEQAQQQAVAILKAADDQRNTVKITVAGPPGAAPPDKVTLKFGIYTGSTSLENVGEWNRLIKAFTESDPQVGLITLDHIPPTSADFGKKVQAMPQTEDCFYDGYTGLGTYKTSEILPLDPLLDADPAVKREAIVGLGAFQQNNKTYAMPLGVDVSMLTYDKAQFDKAGVPLPVNGWTVNQFLDAIKQIHTTYPDWPTMYAPVHQADYLLMLVIAQGFLPVDRRTVPPGINFTDPKIVDAIRQIADLARKGTIYYQRSAGFVFTVKSPKGSPAITVANQGQVLTTFPTGADYDPVSYSVSAGFVSARTPYPEACYRWLRMIARHPELFGQMPADGTLLNDPAVNGGWTPDVLAAYKRQFAVLQSPRAITLSAIGDPLTLLWLRHALDRYILENADLESELSNAELITKAYLECQKTLPAANAPSAFNFVVDCAIKVDPTFTATYGGSN